MREILLLIVFLFSYMGIYAQKNAVSNSCPGVLINGVCWAKYNVDEPGTFANPGKPYGMFYQWNRKKGWPVTGNVTGWNNSLEPGNTWEPANDPCPAGWRIPTVEEIETLADETKVTYTEQAGKDRVLGSRYTDIVTGNTLFLPTVGYRDAQGIENNVLWVHYWSGTDYWMLDRYGASRHPYDYAYGYSVRCVADENACDIVLSVSENICKEALPYTWRDTTFRKGTTTGEYRIRRTDLASGCDSIFYLYLTVDTLCGKPCKERGVQVNEVCWAESNVDSPNTFADTPESFGLLYQWNRKKGLPLQGDIDPDNWMSYDSYVRWEAVNNPCPADWRIPSIEEMYALLDEERVTREWVQQHGVYGLRFTDKISGNTVFLPPAGSRVGPTDSNNDDNTGFYWSTTVYDEKAVWCVLFWDKSVYTSYFSPGAHSVRCVAGRDTTGCVTTVTDTTVTICTKDLPYMWCDTTFQVGTVSGTYRFQRISTTGCDSIVNLQLTVDECKKPRKGVLYNGVCWAESNVDKPGTFAATPLSYGMLYQWNSKKGWLVTESIPDRNNQTAVASHWETVNDPCPNGWRIPTIEEAKTLDYRKGGIRVSNPTRDYVCYRDKDQTDTVWFPTFFKQLAYNTTVAVSQCGYWSSSGDIDDDSKAWMFVPRLDAWPIRDLLAARDYAFYIRCVAERHDSIVSDTSVTIFTEDLPYTWRDTIFQVGTKTGTYRFQQSNCAFTNIIDLHLTVKECTTITNTSATICTKYLPYTWNDTTFGVGTESGVYRFQRISTVTGCDSVVYLELTVHQPSDLHFFGEICSGSPYEEDGFSLPAVYADTVVRKSFKTQWGCDSVRTLVLTVHPVRDTTVYDTICQGEPYYRHGLNLSSVTESLEDKRTLETVHGCDSTVTLHLTVWPSYFHTEPKDICEGDTIAFGGRKLYESGVYHDSSKTVHGCDSILQMILTVHPIHDFHFIDDVCYGEPYNDNGFSFPVVYTDTVVREAFKTPWGCDSVRTLVLTVHPVRDTTVYDTICEGEPYYRHGLEMASVTESRTYKRTLETVHGCDSIVTLRLTVHKKHLFPESRDICEGDSTEFRDKWYSESGTYDDSLKTVAGCDSIFRLELTVHQPYDLHFSGDVCSGKPYNKNGFSLPAVYADTVVRKSFKTQWECDSVRTLVLTVHPVRDTIVYDTICEGEPYYRHDLELPSVHKSLVDKRTLETVHGCDSIVTLRLTVHKKHLFPESRDICEGDSTEFRGKWYSKSGTYDDSLKTVAGCDSIFRLELTVHSVYDLHFDDDVCSGNSYNGNGFSLPAVYADTVVRKAFKTAVWGCDSIRTLHLTVHPVHDTPLLDTVCQGDDYRAHGFSLTDVQSGGEHPLTLPSRFGCDSVLHLQLTVLPSYNLTLYDSVCPSVRYDKHGFQFPDVMESGRYVHYLKTLAGCDSIVTLDLHVHRDYLFAETRNACDGDTVDFRGKLLYESGTYDDPLQTVLDCDSIYRLTLNVHPVYAVPLTDILCEGVPYTRNGFNLTEPGTHVLRLKTVHGCDSIVTLELAEEKKVHGDIVLSLEDCETHGYAFFFEPDSTSGTWRWDMGDGSTYRTQEGYHTYADSGTYRVTLQLETPGGCGTEYAREQWVPNYAREVAIRTNRTAIDAETPSVRFRAEAPAGTMCRWEFGDGKTAEGVETEHVYDAEFARFYDAVLRVFNADSCVTEESVRIEVLPLPKEVNTFSPNGDGINDVFMAEFRVEIFNRNGLRIYAGDHGWDGTSRTGNAREDTYFYKLYYRTAMGDRVKTGYVMLVR